MVEVALHRLAQAPVPAKLAEVERKVLGSIAAEGPHSGGALVRELRFAAAIGALVMGIAAGALPSSEASASSSLTPLDGTSALFPSSLLLRDS